MSSLRLLKVASGAINLARYSSRLVAIQLRINGNLAPRTGVPIASNHNLVASFNYNPIASISVRPYSSEGGELTKNQIEEKVLQILSNFDRIKENPAKPQVCEYSEVYFSILFDLFSYFILIVMIVY
jgi:hypothetical protein